MRHIVDIKKKKTTKHKRKIAGKLHHHIQIGNRKRMKKKSRRKYGKPFNKSSNILANVPMYFMLRKKKERKKFVRIALPIARYIFMFSAHT